MSSAPNCGDYGVGVEPGGAQQKQMWDMALPSTGSGVHTNRRAEGSAHGGHEGLEMEGY